MAHASAHTPLLHTLACPQVSLRHFRAFQLVEHAEESSDFWVAAREYRSEASARLASEARAQAYGQSYGSRKVTLSVDARSSAGSGGGGSRASSPGGRESSGGRKSKASRKSKLSGRKGSAEGSATPSTPSTASEWLSAKARELTEPLSTPSLCPHPLFTPSVHRRSS